MASDDPKTELEKRLQPGEVLEVFGKATSGLKPAAETEPPDSEPGVFETLSTTYITPPDYESPIRVLRTEEAYVRQDKNPVHWPFTVSSGYLRLLMFTPIHGEDAGKCGIAVLFEPDQEDDPSVHWLSPALDDIGSHMGWDPPDRVLAQPWSSDPDTINPVIRLMFSAFPDLDFDQWDDDSRASTALN